MKSSYLSRVATVNWLKKFYANTSRDVVSVDEIFVAANRDLDQKKKNKSWLSNKLTSMQAHGLFTRHYSKDGRLAKLQLTTEGRRALGRDLLNVVVTPDQAAFPSFSDQNSTQNKSVSVSAVRRDVEALRLQEPELEIEFTVKLREEPVSR